MPIHLLGVGAPLLILACLLTIQAPQSARAAPIGLGLSANVSPMDYAPGEGGYVTVGGAYPIDVSVTLDSKPLEVFWSGDSYRALFTFKLDEPPGSHTIAIEAYNPVDGTSLKQAYGLTVHATGFPTDDVNVPSALGPLLDSNLNDDETGVLSAIQAATTHPVSFSWPFAMPVSNAVIISGYGNYRIYNGGLLMTRHSGVDLRSSLGSPIQATADGQVVSAQLFRIHGNVVIIDHGFGVYSLYAHLSEFMVKPGDRVRQGQVIGLAGYSGRASGPHLHFEIVVNGIPVDPIKWMALAPDFVPPGQQVVAEPPGS